ncbi:hypothetical protein AAIH32_06755 [Pseudarthrobacter oxydans]|uniref:hypothetical protein n=1 Tax=Pseudarthrobacter oxydans TaxID=1671 RepID=UPI003D2A6AA7
MRQHAEETPAGGDSVSHSDVTQSREEILEYWTQQRMAEAKPRELRLPQEGPRPEQKGADTGEPESATPDQD